MTAAAQGERWAFNGLANISQRYLLGKNQYVRRFNLIKTKLEIVKGKLLGGGGGQTHPPSHRCLAGPPWSTRGSPYRWRECRDMRKLPSGQTDFSKVFVSFVLKLESVQFPPEKESS